MRASMHRPAGVGAAAQDQCGTGAVSEEHFKRMADAHCHAHLDDRAVERHAKLKVGLWHNAVWHPLLRASA